MIPLLQMGTESLNLPVKGKTLAKNGPSHPHLLLNYTSPSLPDFEINIKINLRKHPPENIRRVAAQFRRFLPGEGPLPLPGSVDIFNSPLRTRH